jgi:uncharacterized protein YlzI (FlbEa/FlbD family)
VIRLHRLGKPEETFFLNPDLVLAVESTPDTLLTLTTHTKLLVAESPEQVVEAIREWRSSILSHASRRAPRTAGAALALVRGTSGDYVDPKGGER